MEKQIKEILEKVNIDVELEKEKDYYVFIEGDRLNQMLGKT